MKPLALLFKSFLRFKHVVAASGLIFALSAPLSAQDVDLPDLLQQLADPDTANWQQLERQIRTEWSRSGSAAMDLLLQRGEKALEEEDFDAALEHLTALTDHAPDFAEGWNARATALFRKSLYGPAMEDIGKALALNPQHFGAMTGLAVILQSVNMEKEALEVWYMVRAIHPHRQEMNDAIDALEAKVGGTAL